MIFLHTYYANTTKQTFTNDVNFFFLFLWQLIINMHTINAVFLFGDAVLNRLVSCNYMVVSISIRFPISFA